MSWRANVPARSPGALLALVFATGAVSLIPTPVSAEQASRPSAPAAGFLDAGKYHTCAVLPSALPASGPLRCWGYGGDGALGYANTATIGDDEVPAASGPVDVGGGRTVKAIGAGHTHTCAILDNNSVRCWGFAGDGRLGYRNITPIGDDEAPSAAGPVDIGMGRTAIAITGARAHTCVILDDGDVRCWGYGLDGRLGYGTTASVGDNELPGSLAPVALGLDRTAKAISAGDLHTCAILDDGNVRCWGYGADGQLGYASTDNIGNDESPDAAGPVDLGSERTAVAITTGDFHTCAILDNATVRCWGFGRRGRLGYASTLDIGDTEVPGSVAAVDLGPGRTAKAITAGAAHTCALLDDDSVRCWGLAASGQLGYANHTDIGDNETPGSVGPVPLGAGRTAIAIVAGGDHTCAKLDDGSTRCWGRGLNGELGYCDAQTIGDDESPATAGPADLGIAGVAGVACALPPPPPPPPPLPPPRVSEPGAGPPAGAAAALAEALRLEQRRSSSYRSCRTTVMKQARVKRDSVRSRYRPRSPARARALRQLVQRAAVGRRKCLTMFGRTPGRVTSLSARASTSRLIVLKFEAPGSDRSKPPAARGYLIKQSTRPIRTVADFERAQALCGGTCTFKITQLRSSITVRVEKLRPGQIYYYAVRARDNVTARTGRRSPTVKATTRAGR